MVSKRNYRCHAHTNAFRDTKIVVPESPVTVNWKQHFENGFPPTFLDIGCGYGKFLIETAKMFPNENVLGFEIRDKVVEYVDQVVNTIPNCSVVKTNALLFLPNFIAPHTLKKVFVLFPDPHFKKKKQKFRMICRQMMAVMEYLLVDGGLLYISTDVSNLFTDMCKTIEESGYFREEKNPDDELFVRCYRGTDEAGRAGVKTGTTFGRVYSVINR